MYQALPRIFIQEAHSNIESCASPALQAIGVLQRVARLLRYVYHFDCPETSRKKRLVCIAPCGVHDQCARVSTNCFSELFGTLLDDDITPTSLAREGRIQRRTILRILAVFELGNDDVFSEARFSLKERLVSILIIYLNLFIETYILALDRTTVDSKISKVSKKFLGTVLALH